MKRQTSKHVSQITKSKKGILTVLSIVLLLVIGATVTYAYLINKKQIENHITLGYNKIELKENYIPPVVMEKGIEFTKEPYVTNTGNVDCYVRVKSVISDSRVADALTIDYQTDHWTYNNEDGYWYYYKAINPMESTTYLFTTVSIADDAPDLVLDGFDIYVYAESVQTVEGKTMEQVWSKN